jgi:tetratricopeptide (TPR) repeat protein
MTMSGDRVERKDAFKKALRLLSSEGVEGALMVVERELVSDPMNWEAWSAKAEILYFQDNHDMSMQCCERSLRINPNNALAYNIKGNILYKLGKYNEAIECYNKAIEIEPLFVRAWYNKKMASELQLKKTSPRVHYLPPSKARKDKHKKH